MLSLCLMFCNGLFRHPKKSLLNDRNNKHGLQGCNSLQKCWCGKNLPLWSCMNCLTFMVVWNQAPRWEKWQKKNIKQSEPSVSLGRRAGSTALPPPQSTAQLTLLVAFVFCSGKSAKSCEIHKNMQNTPKFGRNLIKYMSVQHIWNLSQLLGLFNCSKLWHFSWNFVSETCKQRPEITRCRLRCEKLGTSHDVEGFAIGSFLEPTVVERANFDLC